MGRRDCIQPPVYLFSCPHKPAYKACHQCFLLYSSQMKCGCPEEDIEPIPSVNPPQPLDLSWIKEENLELVEVEPDLLSRDTSLSKDEPIVDKEGGTSTIQPELSHKKRKLDNEEKKMKGTY